ncbi:hypothetical protein BC941DRAFT_415256 [Chlamydoabsidia padenii]|nr:hypothetical protein BC941DRAFT_415256 [Chlamydoabsidia padenii]
MLGFPVLIVIIAGAVLILIVALYLSKLNDKKDKNNYTQYRLAQPSDYPLGPITLPQPGTLPSLSTEAFRDRRHPSWAAAEAEILQTRPNSHRPTNSHRPSSHPPNSRRPNHHRSPRPAYIPDPNTARHPTWVLAAVQAEEEEAARRGEPPPFKPQDLSAPPPTYHQHANDIRLQMSP